MVGFAKARAINDEGQVVGSSLTSSGETHAFLWQDGEMADLGTLGGSASYATGINDQGQIVGYATPAGGGQHAFLWQGGVMTDLNSLLSNGAGWTLTTATAINASGQIVGYGRTPSGLTHAYLLTPDSSPAAAGRLRFDVALAQAAGQPHTLLATAVAPGPELRRQPPSPATLADGPIQLEAISTPTPRLTPRHAQDAAFAEWANLLRDTLNLELAL